MITRLIAFVASKKQLLYALSGAIAFLVFFASVIFSCSGVALAQDKCGFIKNTDLRHYCKSECGQISDFNLRNYCKGSCAFISDNDLRYLCEMDKEYYKKQ